MKKILFLHGFFASGSCPLAVTLREELQDTAEVLSPDLPIDPHQALREILQICRTERPDLLVGNSCGAFYAHLVSQQTGIPALLGNPHFAMTRFLSDRLGDHEYKSLRLDRQQNFTINPGLVASFAMLEEEQFLAEKKISREKIWGLFGENDTLAHYEPIFLKHYTHSFHFPGAHTPTELEVKKWYVPLVRKMLGCY